MIYVGLLLGNGSSEIVKLSLKKRMWVISFDYILELLISAKSLAWSCEFCCDFFPQAP